MRNRGSKSLNNILKFTWLTSIRITTQTHETIWWLILNLIVCLLLYFESVTSLLTKTGSGGKKKKVEMINVEVQHHEVYSWLRIRTC